MAILILHGYGLTGSGSNVYVANLTKHLTEAGEQVHVCCQEWESASANLFREVYNYDATAELQTTECPGPLQGPSLHRMHLDTLPVYNWDIYPRYKEVIALPNMKQADVDEYLDSHERLLRHIVASHAINLVHVQHVTPLAEVARRIRADGGPPYVLTPHGSAIEYVAKVDKRFHTMAARCLSEAEAIISGGEEMDNRLRALFSDAMRHTPIQRVPVGVDTNLFTPDTPTSVVSVPPSSSNALTAATDDKLWQQVPKGSSDEDVTQFVEAWRKKYERKLPDPNIQEILLHHDSSKKKIILFHGKLVAGKGLHVLLCAMPQILESHPDTELWFVGEGTSRETLVLLLKAMAAMDRQMFTQILSLVWRLEGKNRAPVKGLEHLNDPDEVDALFAMAQRTQPDQAIRFLGYLSQNQLRTVLQRAHVSVLPSIVAEAYPLSLIESLATGIVPVATDFGGTSAFFDQVLPLLPTERQCVRIKSSPESLLESIAKVISTQLKLPPPPVEDASQIARTHFSWTRVAQQMKGIYETTGVPA